MCSCAACGAGSRGPAGVRAEGSDEGAAGPLKALQIPAGVLDSWCDSSLSCNSFSYVYLPSLTVSKCNDMQVSIQKSHLIELQPAFPLIICSWTIFSCIDSQVLLGKKTNGCCYCGQAGESSARRSLVTVTASPATVAQSRQRWCA